MAISDGIMGKLKFSLETVENFGTDASKGIESPKEVSVISINPTSDGKWIETGTTEPSPVKKDLEARDDELEFYKGELENFSKITEPNDLELVTIIGNINQKKQEILDTIGAAIGAGCSAGINTTPGYNATVNGVVIGISNKVVEDYAFASVYTNLEDTSSESPFKNPTDVELTTSNVGIGYSSNYEINSSEGDVISNPGVGVTFKELSPIQLPGTCTDALNTVNQLATDIDNLRNSIDNQKIEEINMIKSMKTEYQLFVWTYENADARAEESKSRIVDAMNSVKAVS